MGLTWLLALAALSVAPASAMAQPSGGGNRLAIDHIDMKPTKDGFYDATVGFVMTDAKLGKTGAVAFSIVVPDVHDVDEAVTRVHEPIKTLGGDLQAGYRDLHREP